ncbi:sensor domain-containing diguanylate cyclase [Pseudomonas vancouverensis]|uniref:diguanylate cyclase n=1 Tax=Pseudomonas vancouverensis TaxID=95300 RepID=A0A1H2NN37_PSEVA|nr:sensor domain-containing diguanylate cyclase [Pseudomonas vancouverensis]KAB0495281.1 GGDEF domain-containing protein [Pseudomonas vancouverensis]TDB56958.1 GGDEF domain-containing protein [Pseudomonas vancouverensis]SDV06505.1 diguanylate cyclase (GGDEF) domain-containing protein [Pseudomonas vancouverensis]
MKRFWPLPLDLRALILLFVLLSVLATLCNNFIVAYRIQRDALIHTTLESNSAYAAKVASSIEAFIESAQGRMKFSAQVLAAHWSEPEVLRAEASRLQQQDTDFNAVAITDGDGRVLQTAPEALKAEESMLDSENMRQALKEHRALVSAAYTSVSGHLVIFISQPIVSSSGQFLGVIGGSIYLLQQSALHSVISRHFHHEGTFVFVTDGNRRLLYHPTPQRIGAILGSDKPVDAALRGENGAMVVTGEEGEPLLAGYAPVVDAHWAVVAVQPEERALAPLTPLMSHIIMGMIPAGIVGLGLILACTVLIARPLRQLSNAATQLTAPETESRLQRVQGWYLEAAAIRRALLGGVKLVQQKLGRLNQEARSDALTGLANRRAMDDMLDMLTQAELPYAVLSLDIDHFKRVNDTFGHDAGDVALKHIADILQSNSRSSDLACRSGGEEFVLIMPDTSIAIAQTIAERIRENVAGSDIPGVGKLTLSVGVAFREEAPTCDGLLKLADERLYLAKQGGRNRVVAS